MAFEDEERDDFCPVVSFRSSFGGKLASKIEGETDETKMIIIFIRRDVIVRRKKMKDEFRCCFLPLYFLRIKRSLAVETRNLHFHTCLLESMSPFLSCEQTAVAGGGHMHSFTCLPKRKKVM